MAGRVRWLLFLAVSITATGATVATADVSVTATVDQSRVSFGESFTYTITINGAQSGGQPLLAGVDGLHFNGPSSQTSVRFENGQVSSSLIYTYQVTPTREGEFTIPPAEVEVGRTKFRTAVIQVSVGKGSAPSDDRPALFGKINIGTPQVYVGQVAPVEIDLYSRPDIALRSFSGFNCEGENLGFKFSPQAQSGTRTVNGEMYNVHRITGAISALAAGKWTFGPCVAKAVVAVQNRNRQRRGFGFDDPFFDNIFGMEEHREAPIAIEAVPIESQGLPVEGRPDGFAGAVGRWNLDVSATPTELQAGDPITLRVKIGGEGNIDTVPLVAFSGLEEFKTYDATAKTTKNDLGTQGEKESEQVLIPKNAEVKQLPEIRLVYFDPIDKAYRTAKWDPIQLIVKAGNGGASTIVGSSGQKLKSNEKLGQDIVYLKGDLGPVATDTFFCATPTFWMLNLTPLLTLAGSLIWKRRTDKLRGDVAYARRSRAARQALKLLESAANYDHVQRALQSYLGDRLNIPSSGLTASVVDEQLAIRGLDKTLLAELRRCFDECDTARFAGGGSGNASVESIQTTVKTLIDELEKKSF